MAEAAEEPVFVYTTWPSPEAAEAAGAALVEARLAACVNIVPGMRTIYRWQGAIERDEETVMIVKTRRGQVEAIVAAVRHRHPYDEPALAVLPLAGGSASYLEWMRRESGG